MFYKMEETSQHSFASSGDPSGTRVKLLISYNGKVMPRPSDRKLRYVGGDTRIISVHRYITYADFMLKIMEAYGQPLLLKYQLPDEELDALISVSSDEDLENMMDEYERLDADDGAPRMRLFLFADGDYDALHLNDTTDPRLWERRYVEAVNGVQGISLQTLLEQTIVGASKDLLGLNFSEALDPSQFSGTVSVAMHSSGFIPEVIVSVMQSAPTVHSFPPKQVVVNTSSAYPDVTSPPQLLFGTNKYTHSNFNMNGALLAGGVYHQVECPTNGITSLQAQLDPDYSIKLQDGLSLRGSNTPIRESIVPTMDLHNFLQNVDNHGKLSVIEPQEKMLKMRERIEHPSQADDRRMEIYSDSSAPVASQQCLVSETSWQQHLDNVSDTGQGINIWEDTHLHMGHVQQDFVQQNLNASSSIYQQLEHPHEEHVMLGGGYTLTSSGPTCETGTLPSYSSQIELGGNYKKQNAGQHSSGESKLTSNHGMLAGHNSRSESTTMATGYNEQVICKEQPIQAQFLDHQNSPQEPLSAPSFASGSLGSTMPLYTDFVPYKGRVAGLHNRQEVIGQFHLDGQKSLSDSHVISSGEFHEQQFAVHPYYQNGENEVDWVFEERSNEFVESRAHREKHTVVGQKMSEENRCVREDSIVTSSAETRHTSLLGINHGGDLLQPKSDVGPFDLERNSLAVDRAVFSDTLQAGYSVANSALDFPMESTVFDSDIDPSFKERLPFLSNRGTSIFASPSVTNTSERQRGYVADRFEPTVQISAETGLESLLAKSMPLIGFEKSVAGFDGSSLFAVPITSSLTSAESVVNLGSGYTLPSTTVDFHFKQSKKVEDTAIVFGRPGSSNEYSVSTSDGSRLLPVFDSVSSLDELGYDGRTQVDSRGYGERKNTIEHGSENVAAVGYQPTLYSTPTFSIENWMKELRQSGSDEQAARGSQHEEQIAASQLEAEAESEMVFDDFNNLGIIEDEKAEHKVEEPRNAATIAEEEAVLRGLQIIKYVDLEELCELGSGTFGTVYHGKWRGTDVAIKRIKSSCFAGRPPHRERLIADFWQEACILGQLHHPNVVAFYGIVPDGPGGTLATVTEYMVNGSMKQVLQKKDRSIDRRKRLLIAMDAAFGMEYLHGKKIVHFDLKCENLLVNMRDPQRPICKVADLGLSKVKHQTMVSGGVRGTLPWMAPELLNGSSSLVSEKVDVFSFGVVMWELLTGEEPYANMHYGAIIGGIVNNTLRPQIPNWCDTPWRLLMERCWSAEPKERPGFAEIVAELRAMASSINARAQGQVLSYGRKGHN